MKRAWDYYRKVSSSQKSSVLELTETSSYDANFQYTE
jgi:hypothetical protein